MSLRSDLWTFLTTPAQLYSYVGEGIYPDDVPEDAPYPAITNLIVSMVPEQPIGGGSIKGTLARIQWDVLTQDPDTRDTLRDALIDALCAFPGGPTVTVHDRGIVGAYDSYDSETFISRSSVDWMVLYA